MRRKAITPLRQISLPIIVWQARSYAAAEPPLSTGYSVPLGGTNPRSVPPEGKGPAAKRRVGGLPNLPTMLDTRLSRPWE